ncbi:N-6 DNA methylase [Bradyrhizobium yuanmingense]|uniref:N-6 DNA methylase n=1 Tax=Bradyrhizobium yuanmingense TaxID=108015 RepID=UPI0009426E72|nr:N-6 DNA methylase [Bradyrhizobium yuanmingense]
MQRRLGALAARLGYAGLPTFFTPDRVTGRANHVIRQALTSMGISGILSLEDGFRPSTLKPIIYLAAAGSGAEIEAIRRDVWSQGVAPFLLIVTPDTVEVCSGFEPPSAAAKQVAFDPDAEALPRDLEDFSSRRISSSVTWGNLDLHRESSVDNALVDAIEALNDRARAHFPEFENDRDLINALIGKFIYIYVLIDRGILTPSWLAEKLEGGDQSVVEALFSSDVHRQSTSWTAASAVAAFAAVDGAINGSVFLLSEEQIARIPDGLCHLIHRVIRGGEVLLGAESQPSFFNVSFNVLRTETVSAIYERFVSIEDGEKRRDDGVFYTPPHLADHVLDRLEAVSPITANSRIVDPAAGSGIFLVGAFRRVMEANVPEGGWTPTHIDRAKKLLLSTIHGIEKHPQAANVCRFSLYLTLLEYVGRATIEELIRAAGAEKFLPDLSKNIVCADAFALPEAEERYSHVVGNPPWSMTGGQRDRSNRTGDRKETGADIEAFKAGLKTLRISYAHDRLCDLFTWLALLRLADRGAAVALVINAKSVIGRHANRFSHCLASRATIRWTGNLSHLRRKLFVGVEASAFVFVALNRPPTGTDRVETYRPLLSSLPTGRRREIWSLLASQSDIQVQRSQDLQRGANGWFTQTMLSEFDRRMREALEVWSVSEERTFGDFVQRSNLVISKGGSPKETGVARSDRTGTAQAHPLSRSEFARVTAEYRGYYAGNVILIPRSMKEATFWPDPVAYPSTFNGLIPASQYEDLKRSARKLGHTEKFDPKLVAGLLAYLNSTVVKYFASLFGASFLMDQARLEKNDLLSLPCPFEGPNDESLLALGKVEDVDSAILDAMEAGSDFRKAFKEFAVFRRYFANAQIPKDSLKRPSSEAVKTYMTRLVAELQSSFDAKRKVRATTSHDGSERTYVIIAIGKREGAAPAPGHFEGQFLGNSLVTYDAELETSVIAKAPSRSAWTIDQAVADAAALSREIRGSHA